jgi:hypothetical protein
MLFSIFNSKNENDQLSKGKCIAILICFYFLVHFLLLLLRGYFWDDWVWVENDQEIVKAMNSFGFMFWKPISIFIYSSIENSVWSFSIIFSSWLIVAIIFFEIYLQLFKNSRQALLISILQCSMPFMIVGRSTTCTAHYSWTTALFSIGLWWLIKNYNKKISLLAIPILFFSFSTASLIPLFMFIFSSFIAFQVYNKHKPSLLNALFLLTPFVFWLFKVYFYPTSGLFHSYNSISFTGYFFDLDKQINESFRQLLLPVIFWFDAYETTIIKYVKYSLILVIFGTFIWPKTKFIFKKTFPSTVLLIFGAVGTLVAAFPYLLVGKFASLNNWESRHLLLFTLIAPYFYFGVYLFLKNFSKGFAKIFIASNIILGSFMTVHFYLGVHQRSMHQTGIIEHFKLIGLTASPQNFLVDNRLQNFYLTDIRYSFYDYSGMINTFSSRENTLITNQQEWNDFKQDKTLISIKENYRKMFKISGVDFNLYPSKLITFRNAAPNSYSYLFNFIKSQFTDVASSRRLALDSVKIEISNN